ncbi:hypothetical protein [Streptomyces sp. NPDC127190]|uniref:hypothetical protein n=1 Tax=unclassified Streptomyces TaxID=2593676 RepID=UPI00363E0C70
MVGVQPLQLGHCPTLSVAEYGGRLERRLRTLDDQVEAHVITFPHSEDLAAYRADPRRSAAAPLLESSGAAVELLAVRDVWCRAGVIEGAFFHLADSQRWDADPRRRP